MGGPCAVAPGFDVDSVTHARPQREATCRATIRDIIAESRIERITECIPAGLVNTSDTPDVAPDLAVFEQFGNCAFEHLIALPIEQHALVVHPRE